MKGTRGKVLLAMSGGVDSSVAAKLLLDQGYEVTGVFMCLGTVGDPDSDTRGCCSPQDAADARMVAQTLGIELYVLNFADDFSRIVNYFVDEYRRGRTPNPCIHCNTFLKFGKLIEHAQSLGIPYVATGHYARIVHVEGKPQIARKQPRPKDQSYVLFGISKSNLDRILFPLGEIEEKAKVREIARESGLKVFDKPDSQEVCFISDNDYVGFLRRRCPEALKPGKFIDKTGKKLGQHSGYAQYTIGQRRGLGLPSLTPLFVTAIDAGSATVTVGSKEDLLQKRLTANSANWHAEVPEEFQAIVQIRYNHSGAPARVKRLDDDRFEVTFDEPIGAITPGQAAVCYDGDRLLGGGWIESHQA